MPKVHQVDEVFVLVVGFDSPIIRNRRALAKGAEKIDGAAIERDGGSNKVLLGDRQKLDRIQLVSYPKEGGLQV